MKVRIIVTFKKSILDPQGKAVQQALQTMGYKEVKEVRLGKYIDMELVDLPNDMAKSKVAEMCERLLANMVIEEYRFEIHDK
jgi:phosphoribosylformylglycinamidine synthase subunit PurS